MPLALSIVIPAHNEAIRIQRGFDRLRPALDVFGEDNVEVIVIDDGSSDETGLVAAKIYGVLPHTLIVRQELNLGKGAAVRLGFAIARAEKVVTCDADMAISPTHLHDAASALDEHSLVFATRATDGAIRYDSHLRTWSGALFNALVRREVDTTLRDTQCGFKGFRLAPARLLGAFGLVEGFAFDVEMIYLAKRLGLEISTIAVSWDDVKGSSVHLLSDSRKMLRDIRGLSKSTYECPVVRVDSNVDPARVGQLARASRIQGLLIARSDSDALVVLPRSGVIAGIEIAAQLGGVIGVAVPEEFRNRTLLAV